MELTLYHGSSIKFGHPDLSKCPKYEREFGQGFYLSDDINVAKYYGTSDALAYDKDHYYIPATLKSHNILKPSQKI
jgi:hypothetical protein